VYGSKEGEGRAEGVKKISRFLYLGTKIYDLNIRPKYTTIISYRRRNWLYDQDYTTCRIFYLYDIWHYTTLCECRVAGVYLVFTDHVSILPTFLISSLLYQNSYVEKIPTQAVSRVNNTASNTFVEKNVLFKCWWNCHLGLCQIHQPNGANHKGVWQKIALLCFINICSKLSRHNLDSNWQSNQLQYFAPKTIHLKTSKSFIANAAHEMLVKQSPGFNLGL